MKNVRPIPALTSEQKELYGYISNNKELLSIENVLALAIKLYGTEIFEGSHNQNPDK
jgi:hypothetical protein